MEGNPAQPFSVALHVPQAVAAVNSIVLPAALLQPSFACHGITCVAVNNTVWPAAMPLGLICMRNGMILADKD